MTPEPAGHQCRQWAPPDVLRDLPMAQQGDGRHKCATCAYAKGYQDGMDAALTLLAERERAPSSEVESSNL